MKAQGKKFLTERGDEGGSLRWFINTEGEEHAWKVESSLTLTDCYRHITLEFHAGTKPQCLKRVAKLDTLIEELQEFRESLSKSLSTFDRPKFF